MSKRKSILILYPLSDTATAAAQGLADALISLGATVTLQNFNARYKDILDAIACTDTVLVWR